MSDTNKTVTDVIRDIRSEADYIEKSARGSLKAGENLAGTPFTESDLESALDLAETKRKEADSLEVALKREKATEEQEARFDEFCVSHYTPPNKDGVVPDGCNCPCYVRGRGCNAFTWTQMPYVEKEGGA